MYEDMTYMQNSSYKKKNNISCNMIIIGLVVIALIISYFLIFKNIFKDKNVKMEERLVKEARDYVLKNNIYTNKEIYIDVSKLNITLNDNCSLISGVIYDGEKYYPNLVCSDYKSKVIKANQETSEYIALKGDEVMILARGMTFYDPGYISNDIVVPIGNVGTEEGVYNIYYKTTNSNNIVNRKVIIINNQEIKNLFPTISLNGEDLIYLVAGNNYQEEGVSAYDTYDGNISSNVKIDGTVNNTIKGEYIIGYTVTNSRGYSNTVTRKINVIDNETDLIIDYKLTPSTLTNENVLINLIVSNEYNKIIYPNGTEGNSLSYEVEENGIYKFIIYDKYDRAIEKEIEIDNIDREVPQGSCTATRYYNKTEIKVDMTTNKEISSYEYYLNNNLVQSTQSNYYISTVAKPSIVQVKVKDSINNQNELTCSFKDIGRQIVTNSKGKNCLEGYTCYIQFDYGDSQRYPFCSMQDKPNSCGGIGRNGCSLTSASNAIAFFGIKSKTGVLHTPYTVWDELYPVNKNTGQCNGGCSGWTRIRDAVVNAGLSAPRRVSSLNRNTLPQLLDNLRKGYPVIIHAKGKPFSSSTAHYMALLAIRDDGYVFLSDSANTSGTKKGTYNGKAYYVDTWISPDDLITGNVDEFLLVGPYGVYEGK